MRQPLLQSTGSIMIARHFALVPLENCSRISSRFHGATTVLSAGFHLAPRSEPRIGCSSRPDMSPSCELVAE